MTHLAWYFGFTISHRQTIGNVDRDTIGRRPPTELLWLNCLKLGAGPSLDSRLAGPGKEGHVLESWAIVFTPGFHGAGQCFYSRLPLEWTIVLTPGCHRSGPFVYTPGFHWSCEDNRTREQHGLSSRGNAAWGQV